MPAELRHGYISSLFAKYWKRYPELTLTEILAQLQLKAAEVPLVDTEEKRIEFAMRVKLFGQGPTMGSPNFDWEIYLDQPLLEDSVCYKCGMRTQRQLNEAGCASECK